MNKTGSTTQSRAAKSPRAAVAFLGLVSLLFAGCGTNSAPAPVPMELPSSANAEGQVDFVWEEPMIDVVKVPPGLDPEGHYYRPAHEAVVEVRQGKWRYYRDKQGQDGR